MSVAKVEMVGLDEFRAALRGMPQSLSQEANAIITAHAEEARRQVQAGYPEGETGNLRLGVTMAVQHSGAYGASAQVRSRAKHAWIFENGTKARRTSKGYNRGSMPQPPARQRMLPTVIARRAQMVRALKAMLEQHGLLVRETA